MCEYRHELEGFRAEFGGVRNLPDVRFFLFGMGPRTKLLYKSGMLVAVPAGKLVRRWEIRDETIDPSSYRVALTTRAGEQVVIREDEQAVWIDEEGKAVVVVGTRTPLKLPWFEGYRYPRILRVLHQEMLINVVEGRPVPNLFVYPRPWYRDGAMMAMCFKSTGNLGVIRDWTLGLSDPYDRNNNGEREADNLGQALYLLSHFTDKSHPLVAKILKEFPRFEVSGREGKYLRGRSDFAEHPVYQTRWAKLGLKALGLPDPYVVPHVEDSYAALFWMGEKVSQVEGHDAGDRKKYPYLGWASDHFHGRKQGPISDRDYPLTWEQDASQANYEGIRLLSGEYVRGRIAAPHSWHAAEAFLYLLELKPNAHPDRPGQFHPCAFSGSLRCAVVCHQLARKLPGEPSLPGGNKGGLLMRKHGRCLCGCMWR